MKKRKKKERKNETAKSTTVQYGHTGNRGYEGNRDRRIDSFRLAASNLRNMKLGTLFIT